MVTEQKRVGRPPGSRTLGSYKCPICGPQWPLRKVGSSHSEGEISWRQRRCENCGLEGTEISVLVLGAALEGVVASRVVALVAEIRQLLRVDGGKA